MLPIKTTIYRKPGFTAAFSLIPNSAVNGGFTVLTILTNQWAVQWVHTSSLIKNIRCFSPAKLTINRTEEVKVSLNIGRNIKLQLPQIYRPGTTLIEDVLDLLELKRPKFNASLITQSLSAGKELQFVHKLYKTLSKRRQRSLGIYIRDSVQTRTKPLGLSWQTGVLPE